jgi:hypothetical protein
VQSAKADGGLRMSPEQENKLMAAIATTGKNAQFDQAIVEAGPNIASFVKIEACTPDANRGALLNAYAAPGKDFGWYWLPMNGMKYHDKSKCASVLRLQGWSMPLKVVLRFEAVFISDNSGESVKTTHELVKQPSGEWLFAQ